MSRFSDDYDDYENWALNMGRWERNSRVALKGKRGRKALAELREALMALPQHRLIEGAMCTVGAERRAAAMPDSPWGTNYEREELRHFYSDQGEGVCAIGAMLWYRKVKAGEDPQQAFDALPVILGSGDGDGLAATARLAADDAGLAFTLAWNLAYRNDETFRSMTPEERHAAFVAWIDRELAETAAA